MRSTKDKYDDIMKVINSFDFEYFNKDYLVKTLLGEDLKLLERRKKINKILNKGDEI